MRVAGKVLRYVGIIWILLVLAQSIGRIQGVSAVIGLADALAVFNWMSFLANVVPAAACILIGERLESRNPPKRIPKPKKET
jgi:hypothetical protein